MDTALDRNGDFAVDQFDRLFFLSGSDEMKQQVYILLSVQKGTFLYDRDLGSDVAAAGDQLTLIEAKARCALKKMPEAEVIGVRREEGILTVSVAVNGERMDVAVRRGENE